MLLRFQLLSTAGVLPKPEAWGSLQVSHLGSGAMALSRRLAVASEDASAASRVLMLQPALHSGLGVPWQRLNLGSHHTPPLDYFIIYLDGLFIDLAYAVSYC